METITVSTTAVEVRPVQSRTSHSFKQINNIVSWNSTLLYYFGNYSVESSVCEALIYSRKSIFINGWWNDWEYVWLWFHVLKCFDEIQIIILKKLLVPLVVFAVICSNKKNDSTNVILECYLGPFIFFNGSITFLVNTSPPGRVFHEIKLPFRILGMVEAITQQLKSFFHKISIPNLLHIGSTKSISDWISVSQYKCFIIIPISSYCIYHVSELLAVLGLISLNNFIEVLG